MGNQDKASNKAQDLKGRVKEGVGDVTENDDLKGKGKADQAKSSLKDAGERIKDAGKSAKDAVTGS
jgi:uncharacterized protein YjbJ (UPF0337 family)